MQSIYFSDDFFTKTYLLVDTLSRLEFLHEDLDELLLDFALVLLEEDVVAVLRDDTTDEGSGAQPGGLTENGLVLALLGQSDDHLGDLLRGVGGLLKHQVR